VLDTGTGAQFLVSRTSDPDEHTAAELAVELGGLPLALEQAAAYIQSTADTMAGYLTLFRDRRADLLRRGQAAGHPLTVAATFGLALSQLDAEAPAAVGFLRLLACLAPEPVPLSLLLASPSAFDDLPAAIAGIVAPLLADRVALGDAVAALRQYSLASPDGAGRMLVHPLVQAVALDQTPKGQEADYRQTAARFIEAAIPADTAKPASWAMCAALLPHARAVLGLTSWGLWRIATYLGHSGSYLAARDLMSQIAEAHEHSADYGPEHPNTINARDNLAAWTGEAGEAAAARDQFAVLLPIREKVLGPEHPDTLSARGNLAAWTGEAGDAAAARDQYAVLLPVRMERWGPRTLDVDIIVSWRRCSARTTRTR
jgi:hypothetical protein